MACRCAECVGMRAGLTTTTPLTQDELSELVAVAGGPVTMRHVWLLKRLVVEVRARRNGDDPSRG